MRIRANTYMVPRKHLLHSEYLVLLVALVLRRPAQESEHSEHEVGGRGKTRHLVCLIPAPCVQRKSCCMTLHTL